MARRRVMMVGFDGFESTIAQPLLSAGRLPSLARIMRSSATIGLDHGEAKLTGLAQEHVSTGLSPEDSGRWGTVDFDPRTYGTVQYLTDSEPFPKHLKSRTTVFDSPYFNLREADNVQGYVGWGAHDPGVLPAARPRALIEEVAARFGPYPAQEWVYGLSWPSVELTRAAGDALVRAVELRFDIAEWLFAERLPEWDLAMMVIAEFHSSVEACWHGVDPDHPLHHLPSSAAAREVIERVYETTDRRLDPFMARFPDVTFLHFNMHGMGPNRSDPASMLLLPELMYRMNFGRPYLPERVWPTTDAGVPLLGDEPSWEAAVNAGLPIARWRPARVARAIPRRLRRLFHPAAPEHSLDWMPAARYDRFWPRMRAFALPSFYDGRIRINLKGRERRGMVEPGEYAALCEQIEAMLRACEDPVTGKPVVDSIEWRREPRMDLHASDADITCSWSAMPTGMVHPELGQIGPFPFRRMGGHTGGLGFAHVMGPGIKPEDYGTRSSFDVVPTVVDMLGERPNAPMSGESFRDLIEA